MCSAQKHNFVAEICRYRDGKRRRGRLPLILRQLFLPNIERNSSRCFGKPRSELFPRNYRETTIDRERGTRALESHRTYASVIRNMVENSQDRWNPHNHSVCDESKVNEGEYILQDRFESTLPSFSSLSVSSYVPFPWEDSHQRSFVSGIPLIRGIINVRPLERCIEMKKGRVHKWDKGNVALLSAELWLNSRRGWARLRNKLCETWVNGDKPHIHRVVQN